MNWINPFIQIYNIAKEVLDDYNNKTTKFKNAAEPSRVTMHPNMEMIVENNADFRQNNFSNINKVAVFIPDPVDIQGT